MTQITPYMFEGASVRALEIDGQPHFVGKDVAEALGYVNPSAAFTAHCKGIAKRYPLQTGGGVQEVRMLAEPDVLRLIVNSTLPAAERFERWVFEEVLPAIRQTGAYQVPMTPGEMALAQAQAMVALERQHAAMQQTIARVESRVDDLAESRVWDHCPQNCEPISKIRTRMNERFGLPKEIVDLVVWRLPLSPKPAGMVRNQREEAQGSQYAVYAVADITRVFDRFVSECVRETTVFWSHRDVPKRFQLLPSGKVPKPLRAHLTQGDA